MSGLGKQAKTLNKAQIEMISAYLRNKRNGLRNQTIFLLSVRAGLRAKEIAGLTWEMVLTPSGEISDCIHLTNRASKGKSGGRIIPMHNSIRSNLEVLIDQCSSDGFVISSERSKSVAPQMIVNLFRGWYAELGLAGCSSHSGRRTFLTTLAQKINLVGGSLRDVQLLAGHKSLQTTQRYIETNSEAQRKVVAVL
ncbi:MAG: site-specific integrase [Deltaproteobacteria bacterium]|jgi:integrase